MTGLTEQTRRHIRAMFAPADVDAVERALAQCEHDERIRFAAIRFSGGRLPRLREAIDLAALDWRDLLVAAGFAEDTTAHTSWQPRTFNTEVVNQWFAEGSLPGVVFSPNQLVTITTGAGEIHFGSIISLEGLEPEPQYLVELASGADLTVFQRNLARAD
jgi:hypothetical protein